MIQHLQLPVLQLGNPPIGNIKIGPVVSQTMQRLMILAATLEMSLTFGKAAQPIVKQQSLLFLLMGSYSEMIGGFKGVMLQVSSIQLLYMVLGSLLANKHTFVF